MSEPSKLQLWFRLFLIFLKVNLLTTAGPTSIGLLYKECVGRLMTEAQFVEAVGFSNLVPGSEALKLAMLKNLSSAGSLFCNDRNSRARKTVAPTIQRTMCIGGLCHSS